MRRDQDLAEFASELRKRREENKLQLHVNGNIDIHLHICTSTSTSTSSFTSKLAFSILLALIVDVEVEVEFDQGHCEFLIRTEGDACQKLWKNYDEDYEQQFATQGATRIIKSANTDHMTKFKKAFWAVKKS